MDEAFISSSAGNRLGVCLQCAVANDSRRERVDISGVSLETNSCQPYPGPVPLVGSVGCAAEVAKANTLTRQKVTGGGIEVFIWMPGQKFYLWIEQHRLVCGLNVYMT